MFIFLCIYASCGLFLLHMLNKEKQTTTTSYVGERKGSSD